MGITKQQRAEKRKKAEARHEAYAQLTLDEKIARAGTKEKAKLLKKKAA